VLAAHAYFLLTQDFQPTMIPAGDDIDGMIVEEDIGWILVVEKEVLN
jgi:hypothetical protein